MGGFVGSERDPDYGARRRIARTARMWQRGTARWFSALGQDPVSNQTLGSLSSRNAMDIGATIPAFRAVMGLAETAP